MSQGSPIQMQHLHDPIGLGFAQPTIEVVNCIFVATGTYQSMVHRPFNGTLNQEGLNLFMNQTRGGTDVNVATLAGISNHLLAPVTAPQGIIGIQNGWDKTRVRFYLLIKVTRPASVPIYQAVTGWTDVMGLDFNTQSISPLMRLHFNSVMSVALLENGGFALSDNSQLIYNMPAYAPMMTGGFEVPKVNTLMPEDVMGHIGFMHIAGGMDGQGMDGRGQSAMSPLIKSTRANNLTTSYLDRSINAMLTAKHATDLAATNMFGISSHARGDVRENSVDGDIFINMIRRNSDYDAHGSIPYGQLCNLIPNLGGMVNVVDNRKDLSSNVSNNFGAMQAGNFSDWSNQRPETIFVTRLIQTIPSIMMELCLSRGHMQVTNMTTDGSEMAISFDGIDSLIPNLDLNNPLMRLQQRLKVEVLRDISLNNAIAYSIVANVNVFGDTYIKVALNGAPPIDYCMPSFCDSVAVPVVAPNTMAIQSVAHTVNLLSSQLIG